MLQHPECTYYECQFYAVVISVTYFKLVTVVLLSPALKISATLNEAIKVKMINFLNSNSNQCLFLFLSHYMVFDVNDI